MNVIAVIPARYQSSRFEGKPLKDLCGRPMLWWVYRQVKKAEGLSAVVVATDDSRIAEMCEAYGMDYEMTSNQHKTSTERLNEVAGRRAADLYVCVNGDEPLIEPGLIEQILPEEKPREKFYCANLMTRIRTAAEVIDATNIKVVTDHRGYALFMSRSPIPYPKASLDYAYYKHVGVLAYTRDALRFFAETEKGYNERIEDVNELRFIEHGMPLKMICVEAETLSVDTPKDLEVVAREIRRRAEKGEVELPE